MQPADPDAGTDGTIDRSSATLVERIDRLAGLSAERWTRASSAPSPAHERARQLHDHVHSYLVPRARSLDAPLIVLLLGPTGAGKSTLINTLAGETVSRTGVLRPTTREAVLLATQEDANLLMLGPLATLPPARVLPVAPGARAGVAIVDAPDIDSVEHDNRALADALVEAADLCLFVTTATRYADRVPWDVLRRVRERGLPLIVVLNRLPPDGRDRRAVLEDVERLMLERDLDAYGDEGRLEIVGVAEGELAETQELLRREAVTPILRRIEALAADREARRALAERALGGALAGVGPLVHRVADDLEHEAIDADALRRSAETIYAEELRAVEDELREGRFLREEVLRQWQAFVGADQVTRLFASGIGRLKGALVAAIRGTPTAPVAIVQEQTTRDLVAITVAHASDAARRTASSWQSESLAASRVAADPSLWSAGAGTAGALEERLQEWLRSIAAAVSGTAASKARLARGASLGINAAGVTVMLSVFAHTGGLTGAEVGVAGATAFLNQKLLEALFGEASMRELIDDARRGLFDALAATLAEDRARFDRLVPESRELRELARELRDTVTGMAG